MHLTWHRRWHRDGALCVRKLPGGGAEILRYRTCSTDVLYQPQQHYQDQHLQTLRPDGRHVGGHLCCGDYVIR